MLSLSGWAKWIALLYARHIVDLEKGKPLCGLDHLRTTTPSRVVDWTEVVERIRYVKGYGGFLQQSKSYQLKYPQFRECFTSYPL